MDYFSSDRLRENLRKKTIRGGVFTVSSQFIQFAIGLAVVPILARLLDRADFGVAVKATALTGFAALLVDAGLSLATIQRPDLSHRQATNLFWISSALGTLLGLAVACAGPLVSAFYSDPRYTQACLLIACSYPLSGLAMQHQALLNRALQYDRIETIRIASFVISNAGCVALAWHWQSYWALLWRPVIEAAVRVVLVWIACPWRPGLPRTGSGVRGMVNFGAGVTGASMVGYIANHIDKVLLGRYWSDELTGLYERSMRCFLAPLQQAQGPVQSVVIPVLSRLSDDPDRQKAAYLAVVSRMLCVVGPIVAFLMIQSEPFVLTILGPDYADAVPTFAWLTLAGLVQPLALSLRFMLLYQGRGGELMRVATVNSLIAITTIVIGLPWGPAGVAASLVLGGLALRLPATLWLTCRGSNVRAVEFLRAAASCLPITGTVAAANLVVWSMAGSTSAPVTLLIGSAVSLVAWLIALPWTPLGSMLTMVWSRLRRGPSGSPPTNDPPTPNV